MHDNMNITALLAGLSARNGDRPKYLALADAVEQAFRELQSGYGPLLNKASAEIFSRLTGGKYTGMLVDKSFGLSVME